MPRFDDQYYQRFYGAVGVHDQERIGHLATAVHEMCSWWGVPPTSVLDVGAGVGMWRDWYRAQHPHVEVVSVDISAHACAQWGHEQRDISTWKPSTKFDLVVCHGVLHYLDDSGAESAIINLAAGTGNVMYLELPTAHDLAEVVDPERTDMEVHHRSGEWYRSRLNTHFQQAGAGLWVRRGVVPLYVLEAAAL